jgi:signal peptidase II
MMVPNRFAGARLAWAPVALFVVIADQLTKHWAVNELVDRDIDIFWTLRLNLAYNTGMAFSRGEDLGPIIGVVALVVVVVLLLSLKRQPGRLTDVAVGMIVGGAVGNVIDRLFRQDAWFRGGVVDFIDFQWFPIFNIADIGVTVGGALLVLASWRAGRAPADDLDTTIEIT